MSTAFETIELTFDGPTACLRFNRPDRYNALDAAMAEELERALARLSAEPGLRALMLTGAGEAFHAGGDVKAFAEAGSSAPRVVADLLGVFHGALRRLVRLPVPVVAAVNGVAAGAGFSLAMAADLVLASEAARFTVAYTGIGATPDGGGTWSLPRLVGLRRALELVLTNRVLSAAEALEWGLVTRVLPAEDFAARAAEFTAELAAGPTLAFGRAKALLRESLGADLETQLGREGESLVACAGSADFQQAVLAFAEKRKPAFQGR